jgi:hypothetical protein
MLAHPGGAADKARLRLGNYGADVSSENGKSKKQKKKEKQCKKDASACRADVAGWCGTYWLDYSTCVASLGSCCSFVGKCKYSSADSCIANNPYYFAV